MAGNDCVYEIFDILVRVCGVMKHKNLRVEREESI